MLLMHVGLEMFVCFCVCVPVQVQVHVYHMCIVYIFPVLALVIGNIFSLFCSYLPRT